MATNHKVKITVRCDEVNKNGVMRKKISSRGMDRRNIAYMNEIGEMPRNNER